MVDQPSPDDRLTEDAATWSPHTEPGNTPPPSTSKLGRVRILPLYVFATTDPHDPDLDEIWIADDDNQGEVWARAQAEAECAPHNATVGRLLRVEKQRVRPWAKR